MLPLRQTKVTIYLWQVLQEVIWQGYGEPTRLEQNLLNFVAGEPASQNYLAVRGTYQTIRIIQFGYLGNT